MFCAYCRHELAEDAIFCNRCGKQVKIAQSDSQEPIENGINQNVATSPTIPFQESNPILPQAIETLNPPHKTKQALPTTTELNGLQRFLVSKFQPTLAGNPIFGVMLGCILAIVTGVIASWLLLIIVHLCTASGSHQSFSITSEDIVNNILGVSLFQIPFKGSIELFLVAQGIFVHTPYEGADSSFIAPLHGLLILPAVLLITGGYIAACSDLRNQTQSSLIRGAAIAIPYTFILLILSWQVNSSIPAATSTQAAVIVDTGSLLLFGLLWGVLFGLLGASLKLARGQWRHLLHRYLHTNPHPQIVGMITGACYASVLGLGLSLLTICGFLSYTSFSIPLMARNLCIGGDWQTLTAWGIAQGPLHAVNLFFFSFGTPITISGNQGAAQQCFYSDLSRTTFSLRSQNLNPWTYALLLIPAISLFIGGRISATLARAQKAGPSAISGALITIPFTVIMLCLKFFSTITITDASSATSTLLVLTAGVSVADLLLWSILSGACFGALGGIYQESKAKKWGKRIVAIPIFVVELLATPLYVCAAIISKRVISSLRNPTRSLLYSAFTCAILLAIVTIIVGSLLIANNQTITQQTNIDIRNIVSILLITIPGLLLFCACATSLFRDPVEKLATSSPIKSNE